METNGHTTFLNGDLADHLHSQVVQQEAARHNREWNEKLRLWCRYGSGYGWWGRGCIITPEMRGIYEQWLPIQEFFQSLCRIGRAFWDSNELDMSMVPGGLLDGRYCSLPDFWAAMPESFSGRVSFEPEEMIALFCAVADPPRYGTDTGRYPEQQAFFREWLRQDVGNRQRGNCQIRVADIGCGIGLGTLELAAFLGGQFENYRVTGVTAEPLEVWMAVLRCLPHDVRRQRAFDQYPGNLSVTFQCGDAASFSLPEKQNAIFCNGLVGGAFFHRTVQYLAFLERCHAYLASDGIVLLANHFHAGRSNALQSFRSCAEARGFAVSGVNESLILRVR